MRRELMATTSPSSKFRRSLKKLKERNKWPDKKKLRSKRNCRVKRKDNQGNPGTKRSRNKKSDIEFIIIIQIVLIITIDTKQIVK